MIDYDKLEAFRQTLPEYQQHEKFRFLASWWDVVVARYIIAESEREPKLTAIASWVNMFGLDAEDPLGTSIDRAWALSDACDLEQPLVFVQVDIGEGETSPLLIDGMHKVYKAWHTGQERLPYYMLTVEESNLVRMR